MNWLDIVIGLLLVYAAWEGWRQGVITQVLGLAAVALGIFLAWRYGPGIGISLGMEDLVAVGVGFLLVLIAVIVAVVLIGRLTRGLFRIVGLGIFDNLLGVLFSILKMCLITGIVLILFELADPNGKALKKQITESSVMYRTVMKATDLVFPYVDFLAARFMDNSGTAGGVRAAGVTEESENVHEL